MFQVGGMYYDREPMKQHKKQSSVKHFQVIIMYACARNVAHGPRPPGIKRRCCSCNAKVILN